MHKRVNRCKKSNHKIYDNAVKIDKISISLFMFALESYLLEKKVIQNIQDIKQLDWEIVENYRNILVNRPSTFHVREKTTEVVY